MWRGTGTSELNATKRRERVRGGRSEGEGRERKGGGRGEHTGEGGRECTSKGPIELKMSGMAMGMHPFNFEVLLRESSASCLQSIPSTG